MIYTVEMEIGNGWENVWREDAGEHNPNGTPITFETLEAAIDAIRDHVCDCINAVEGGFLSDSPDPSEFRITTPEGRTYYFTGTPWNYEQERE